MATGTWRIRTVGPGATEAGRRAAAWTGCKTSCRARGDARVGGAEQGHDPEGCCATLAHEATHWTGHPGRLARDLTGRFGPAAYAAEELVAELGAAFAAAALGPATEPRPDHASHMARWLGLLRADRRAVFTAASQAQAATDWLLAAAPGDAAVVTTTPRHGAPPADAPAAE